MRSIGIDLGTTNSVAACILDGAPEVVHYRDEQNQDHVLFPSVVSRTPSGDVVAGPTARRNAQYQPAETIYSIKRMMGLNYTDRRVQQVASQVPYNVCAADEPEDLGVRVMFNGRKHTPIEISTIILQQLVQRCMARLGPIHHATITVPAMFEDCQRNATHEAGAQAGLQLRPILDEPIAAALAFGYGKTRGSGQRLLVYDLGGGTFDVSILQLAGENLQVIDKTGNMWLGGDDFDQVIVNRIYDSLGDGCSAQQRSDPGFRRVVKTLAEKTKIALSSAASVDVIEPVIRLNVDDTELSLKLTVTRQEFEAGIRPMVDSTLEEVDQLLRRNSIDTPLLDAVLLVGGSTQVPVIRELMKRRFGPDKVYTNIDPMNCVALGAAVWNERFPIDRQGKLVMSMMKSTGLTTALDLGIEIFRDGNPHVFEPIIPRGQAYPTRPGSFRKAFKPTAHNQQEFIIPVFEGNSRVTTANSPQGRINLKADRPVPMGTTVWVEFNKDMHGKLTMVVEIEGRPDSRQEFQLERNRPHLDEAEEAELKEWKEDLTKYVMLTENFQQRYTIYLTPEEHQNLNDVIAEANFAIENNRREEARSLTKRFGVVIGGSGLASDLFRAQRAQEMADPATSTLIKQAMTELIGAVDQKQDGRIQFLRDKLNAVSSMVLLRAQQTGTTSGPGGDRLTI